MTKNEKLIDPAARHMCNALTFFGFLAVDYGVSIAGLDKVPPGIGAGDGYYYVAHLISDLGLDWVRSTMADWGYPMPDVAYATLKAAEERIGDYTQTDFPDVFGDDDSWSQHVWKQDQARTGIILLECLRHNFPLYYDAVMKVLGGLLEHYGKTYGIPHYKT